MTLSKDELLWHPRTQILKISLTPNYPVCHNLNTIVVGSATLETFFLVPSHTITPYHKLMQSIIIFLTIC